MNYCLNDLSTLTELHNNEIVIIFRSENYGWIRLKFLKEINFVKDSTVIDLVGDDQTLDGQLTKMIFEILDFADETQIGQEVAFTENDMHYVIGISQSIPTEKIKKIHPECFF